MRYFILSLSFFWVLTSVAQDDQLIAYGKFKVEWGDMENTKILLYKSNQIVDSYRPTKNGKFEFELSLNNEYMFWFEKPGYVTKKVYFNTSVPKSVTDDPEFIPFPDFDFYVTLFKSYPEVDTMFFENPVGKILYNSKSNDFDWDKDYTLKILKRMEEIEDDIKRRHEEAEKLEKENRNQKSPDKIAQDKKKKEENKDDLLQIEANAPNINSENNLKEKRTTREYS